MTVTKSVQSSRGWKAAALVLRRRHAHLKASAETAKPSSCSRMYDWEGHTAHVH